MKIFTSGVTFIKSYIMTDLVGTFCSHFNKIKTILKFLLSFLQEVGATFKKDTWKIRNAKWKTLHSDMALSKALFKTYYKTFHNSNNNLSGSSSSNANTRRSYEYGYINLFNDFWNFKLQKEFLYILFSSLNFLHSGTFFLNI